MNNQNSTMPAQNIQVSFVRLQDMGEYVNFANLMQCKLCDTIKVVFPDFRRSGQFKIVRTEWNVLEDKYNSMDLGELSVTLAEALGLDRTGTDSSMKTLLEPALSPSLTPYSSRCTVSGGVYILGKWRFVQAKLTITTSLSANNTWAVLEGADLPSTGSMCALSAVANKNYGNLSAYISEAGRIVITTGGGALAANDIVLITGWYITS